MAGRLSERGDSVTAVSTEFSFEVETARLRLRRPRASDLDFHVALHTDARLYTHAPQARKSAEENAAHFAGVRQHWEDHGFGYWVVEDRATGEPLGMAGVRRAEGFLNLYYRLRHDSHGRGCAREAAREAVALAAEWLPGVPVRAIVRDGHRASLRTAESSGLFRAGSLRHADDLPEEVPSVMLEAPAVTAARSVDDHDEVLDLWCRVNDSGGSVGFLPGASRADVADALARHEEQMATGQAVLGQMRDPAGRLLGLGWWVSAPNRLLAHGVWLYRLMVDPGLQRRNLGRVLMAGMHAIARQLDDVEMTTLDYRSGSGVGDFYTRCGYTEVGRIPGAIRVAPGDDRDDVIMTRRLDGSTPQPDGRT